MLPLTIFKAMAAAAAAAAKPSLQSLLSAETKRCFPSWQAR